MARSPNRLSSNVKGISRASHTMHYTDLFDIGFGLQDLPDQAPSSVAGDKHDGGVHSSARLLQSTISHSAGDFRLTASPRGSLSNLIATPLPTTNPLPHQVCDWLYRASLSMMKVTHLYRESSSCGRSYMGHSQH